MSQKDSTCAPPALSASCFQRSHVYRRGSLHQREGLGKGQGSSACAPLALGSASRATEAAPQEKDLTKASHAALPSLPSLPSLRPTHVPPTSRDACSQGADSTQSHAGVKLNQDKCHAMSLPPFICAPLTCRPLAGTLAARAPSPQMAAPPSGFGAPARG